MMRRKIVDTLKSNWVFILIVIVGIFLRVYNFHDWLYFYPDQARDVMLVDDVLGGRSTWPLLGPIAASTPFKLGPVYYYFQIISAKIFGSSPVTVAYPDVFFAILSIPLFFCFLRKYFSKNLSLVLVGLYGVSFYAIRYSRFAWNSNPIPFFVLLFLMSLHELLVHKEKTKWKWIILLGISLGVAIQLHTVLLILMPTVLLFTVLYFVRDMKSAWKKLAVVFLLALFLNVSQLVSEMNTSFSNTKDFKKTFDHRSAQEGTDFFDGLITNVACHAQSATLYLSAADNSDPCETKNSILRIGKLEYNASGYGVIVGSVFFGSMLLIFGYLELLRRYQKESDKNKKRFLFLVAVFGVLCFLVLLPAIGVNGQVRYLQPVFFVPYIFLGFLLEIILKNKVKMRLVIAGAVIFLLVGANFFTILFEVKQFASKNRSNEKYVVLGEVEPMVDYMINQSAPQKYAYMMVNDTDYFWNFYKPLYYIAGQKNFNLIRGKNAGRYSDGIPPEQPVFYISKNSNAKLPAKLGGRIIEDYANFGQIRIYKLQN